MLGCFAAFAPLEIDIWKESISRFLPENLREINFKAFEIGRKEIEGGRIR
jgi:Pyruvate/2-oxoacid:ferredoxin oxidoreductase gamma subunit